MSMNHILRQHVASVESHDAPVMMTPSNEELYGEFRAALEEFLEVQDTAVHVIEAIDHLENVDAAADQIQADGDVTEQVVAVHMDAVNEVRAILDEDPMEAISMESLTALEAMAYRVSVESKGTLSKAWDGLVAFIKKIIAAVGNLIDKVNPWSKSRKETVKVVAAEVKSGESSIVVPEETPAVMKEVTKAVDVVVVHDKDILVKMEALLKDGDVAKYEDDIKIYMNQTDAVEKIKAQQAKFDEFMTSNETVNADDIPAVDLISGNMVRIMEELAGSKDTEANMAKANKLLYMAQDLAGKEGSSQEAIKEATRVIMRVVESSGKVESTRTQLCNKAASKKKPRKKGKK